MSEIVDKVLEKLRVERMVCPWWCCYTFDNPLRKVLHNPEAILSPYIRPGCTAIDVGAGMGYFSVPLARLVGPAGHVTAIDIQGKMLEALARRARKHGVSGRIKAHLANSDFPGNHSKADFVIAFWMVHEVPEAVVSVCPIRVSYQPGIREGVAGDVQSKEVWLVEVSIEDTNLEPWLLLTDWPIEDEQGALRVFRMYRQRWAVEDAFKFTKEVLGWEDVQVLNLEGVRTLVALGWVAAGFLYELGVTLEWPEVRLLARLGAWEERPNRPPGKIILTRGLQRLLDNMATNAILADEIKRYGALPPRIAALLGIEQPPAD